MSLGIVWPWLGNLAIAVPGWAALGGIYFAFSGLQRTIGRLFGWLFG